MLTATVQIENKALNMEATSQTENKVLNEEASADQIENKVLNKEASADQTENKVRDKKTPAFKVHLPLDASASPSKRTRAGSGLMMSPVQIDPLAEAEAFGYCSLPYYGLNDVENTQSQCDEDSQLN